LTDKLVFIRVFNAIARKREGMFNTKKGIRMKAYLSISIASVLALSITATAKA
jgi:hypothetical protein